MTITEQLFSVQDSAYADFQSKLTPGIDRSRFIGVRIPQARQLARRLIKESTSGKAGNSDIKREVEAFLRTLPHTYYDEDLLHGLLLSEMKDYDACIEALDAFLPYVDNWAVCDTISPKIFGKHKQELLLKTQEWMSSGRTYTVRFGMGMVMKHFLDEDFKPEYLTLPAQIRSEEYYIRMMQAWLFATALALQWDSTIPYLTDHRLEVWTHNKTIRKAIESYRITDAQKTYLRTLKRSRTRENGSSGM